jgi:hypothetical protein
VSEDPEESRIGVSGDVRLVQVEIAIRDFPIGSGPSIVRDACQEIPKSRGSGNRGFRRQRNRVAGNRDRRYPDSDISVVGPLESEWRTGVLSSGKSREIHGKIPTQSQPSICGTGGNHRKPSAFGPSGNRESRGHDV